MSSLRRVTLGDRRTANNDTGRRKTRPTSLGISPIDSVRRELDPDVDTFLGGDGPSSRSRARDEASRPVVARAGQPTVRPTRRVEVVAC
jgi:hypothetical protein